MDSPEHAAEPALSAQPSTWLASDRALARRVAQPIQGFLAIEASGGLLLVAAMVLAVAWASSPWGQSYQDLFHTRLSFRLGDTTVGETLAHWINDGLMAMFFFVVGLEIKREWVTGELRDRRAAVLPAAAALGGMAVPAAIYALANAGGAGSAGWGIPMATDIAFALGVVALLGSRVPAPLKVFLLAFAILDDIGAIVVIAVFYSDGLSVGWLAAAVGVATAVAVLRRARVRSHPVYVLLGVALWVCTYESGVHATIAGVVMALLTPATPFLGEEAAEAAVDELEGRTDLTAAEVRRTGFLIRESVPLADRLEAMLHPWTSYLIVPVFALANTGVDLAGDGFARASAVSVGVVAGLVLGKPLGIILAVWLTVRTGLGALPADVRTSQVLGVGLLGGIGLTVSIFVAGLAFPEGTRLDQAKAGVLVASVLAGALGATVLTVVARSSRRSATATRATRLAR